MAYVSGTAANISALTAAIISACTSNGWTATAADVVSKGGAFIKLTADTVNDRVTCRAGLGYSGGALTDPCPIDVYVDHPLFNEAWSYPLNYEVHLHGNEVYLVVNWGVDKYTFLGFGTSPVTGIPGTGVWIAGSLSPASNTTTLSWTSNGVINAARFPASSVNVASTGLFIAIGNTSASFTGAACFVHHGIAGWSDTNVFRPVTADGCRQLTLLDNPSVNPTGQTVLVPIQPFVPRGSNKMSMVADLLYARYVRLDTLNPGDIVTFGGDSWKVYPVYKRDGTTRSPSTGVTHSGTHGYAIRYDGP